MIETFKSVGTECPVCKSDDCEVYFDGEYERLVCSHCFYEEWDQPVGTYAALLPREGTGS